MSAQIKQVWTKELVDKELSTFKAYTKGWIGQANRIALGVIVHCNDNNWSNYKVAETLAEFSKIRGPYATAFVKALKECVCMMITKDGIAKRSDKAVKEATDATMAVALAKLEKHGLEAFMPPPKVRPELSFNIKPYLDKITSCKKLIEEAGSLTKETPELIAFKNQLIDTEASLQRILSTIRFNSTLETTKQESMERQTAHRRQREADLEDQLLKEELAEEELVKEELAANA